MATESSMDFSFNPNAGGCTIMAISMPLRCVSIPKIGLPVTIFLPSTFLCDVPIMEKSSLSFSCTSSGIFTVEAFDAIAP